MPRPSIPELASLSDFQTNFHWNLIFAEVPSRGTMGTSMTPEEFNIRCISTDIPTQSKQVIPVDVRGHQVRRVGIVSYSNEITVTLIEAIDVRVMTTVRNWYELNWETKTGIQQYFKDVCQDLKMELLDGLDQPTQTYILKNAWLSNYTPGGTLEGGNGAFLQPTLTFTYDWWEWKADPKEPGGPGDRSQFSL